MTTIICDYRVKTIGCDSMHDFGGRWWKGNKLRPVPNGIMGQAGATTDCDKMTQWFRDGREGKPPKNLEASGLLLREDGLFFVDCDCGLTYVEQGYLAIGSGGDAALAALMAGVSLERALEIACEVDSHSAGPFHIMTLEQALANPSA